MSNLIIPNSSAALPLPRVNVTIRPGVPDDVPFLDSLQKKTTKQVGWMPTKQFEGKITAGHVLVAEQAGVSSQWSEKTENAAVCALSDHSPLTTDHSRVGYLIGNDQYFKRDDVGIIYQINVIPEMRRSLVAALLLKAQFERSAYGCRLYCCWCAQDIEANHFWESMGFVPLAYRAGSEKKSRVHIFWQKRIRSGDTTTPWWFPSQTSGGSIREDRIVLPIPPGTHWSDAKPLILPGDGERKQLNHEDAKPTKKEKKIVSSSNPSSPGGEKSSLGGLRFGAPKPAATIEKPKREKKPKPKHDPRLVAAARELKDRWLEQVNAEPIIVLGKYDVTRVIDERKQIGRVEPVKMLAA